MLKINLTPFPVLTTERLILRRVDMNDANEIFLLRSDERVMEFLDRPRAKSTDDAVQLIQKITDALDKDEAITWGITLKDQTKLIGTIGYWRIEKENYRAEIGYMLDKPFQHKGLMQEAMTAVLDHGFKVMNLHSIEANANPKNSASIKLLERNNFIKEAYFKENYFYDGKFLDSVIYSLLTPGY